LRGYERRAALEIVRATLAADCACQPEDWLSDEIVIVEAREVVGRRRFPMRAKSFSMTTMGNGVVVSCSADRLAWAEANLRHRSRDELFGVTTLALIADFVAPDQQVLAGPHLWYLCVRDTFRPAEIPPGFSLEIFTQTQMPEAYRFQGFHHAVSYRLHNPSPDVIAIVAWHEGRVVGMAGVGADSDQLWQIGMDVVPEYQGLGLGKALVSRATEATLEQGKVPTYSHNISNVRSGNTARTVGYQWAWSGTYARDLGA